LTRKAAWNRQNRTIARGDIEKRLPYWEYGRRGGKSLDLSGQHFFESSGAFDDFEKQSVVDAVGFRLEVAALADDAQRFANQVNFLKNLFCVHHENTLLCSQNLDFLRPGWYDGKGFHTVRADETVLGSVECG
jgi:hypothetical protein